MEADLATLEKKGLPTGISVTHPLSGEPIPVWVANYVLMGYGEGAVMAVPAHDERDFAFALQQDLPIRQVVAVPGQEFSNSAWQDWYADKEHGVCVNSGAYDGLSYQQATDAVAADLQRKELGDKQIQWRLRDWGISRQRYWGCPIPIIHCDQCGAVPVPDDQLPVVLPEDCVPDGSGNPLNRRADFVNCDCPQCGRPARRETDTLDTFVDSSWYYFRYCSHDNSDAMTDRRAAYWMPVDQYIGGIEHAILHLLYSRFWNKVMRDLGLINCDEPFANLLTQGMVLNHIFLRRNEKGGITYFAPDEVEIAYDGNGRIERVTARADGRPVEYAGIGTMSKSKRNGVDPQTLIEEYGADTARFFMMFASPPEQTLEWSDTGVEGAYRFLKRLWNYIYGEDRDNFRTILKEEIQKNRIAEIDWEQAAKEQISARREIHLCLKQANFDLNRYQFNTVASAGMKVLNVLYAEIPAMVKVESGGEHEPTLNTAYAITVESLSILLRMLHPIVPHITDYLWRDLGYGDDILAARWPEPDPAALLQEEIKLIVQVNGKKRAEITLANDAGEETIRCAALANDTVKRYTDGKDVKKIITVPGRLVNIVVA